MNEFSKIAVVVVFSFFFLSVLSVTTDNEKLHFLLYASIAEKWQAEPRCYENVFFSMTNGIINTDLTDDNIIRFMTHLAYKLFDFVAWSLISSVIIKHVKILDQRIRINV